MQKGPSRERLLSFILLVTVGGCVMGVFPQVSVSADSGFQPTMEFIFEQDVPKPGLTMTSWSLINCQISDCSNLGAIIPFGAEFSCSDNECDATIATWLYKYPYYQMEIVFSDGMTRKSNVFVRSYHLAKYKVTIQTESLLVNELEGSNLEGLSTALRLFGLSPLLIPLGCLVVIGVYFILVVISNRFRDTDQSGRTRPPRRKVFTPLWIGVLLFVFLGLMLHATTFLLTLIIETTLGLAYLKYSKIPIEKVLSSILLANVFTQPVFVIALTNLVPSFWTTFILEILVWLAEAGIVNRIQDKQLPFKNILVLTFALNAASFVTGLLLPI